jgi:hypothetical protein
VSGLVPTRIEPIEIGCPRGYVQRKSYAALPIAGRFATAIELRDAFCIEKSAKSAPGTADLAGPAPETWIDFEENDVVAYTFDTRSGVKPMLLERGEELWLRVTTTTCSREPPELASIAFAVSKGTTLNEQKCSLSCR